MLEDDLFTSLSLSASFMCWAMKRTPLRADMTSGDKCFGIVFSLSVTEMILS